MDVSYMVDLFMLVLNPGPESPRIVVSPVLFISLAKLVHVISTDYRPQGKIF